MKTSIISFILFCSISFCFGQYTVALQLQAATGSGCGNITNCATNTVCYDLYGTPSTNGAWVASYDIWFVINNGTGSAVVYSSDASCIIIDNNDFPPSPTTFIRVGANQGNSGDVLNGSTRIHNFCIHYTTIAALNGSTITAGGSFGGFPSNMSVNLNNVPTDAVITPTTWTITSLNNPCEPLPLNWLSFDAVKHDQTCNLNWTTEQQINTAGFVVERSGDGQLFIPIGQIAATKGSPAINKYFFNDAKPLNGTNYYRIKQFDFDGQSDYSEVRSVFFNKNKFSVRAWPNPANNFLNVQVNLEEDESVKIKLINLAGQVVLSKEFNTQLQFTNLDISELQTGMYNLSIEGSQEFYLEKIVVIK